MKTILVELCFKYCALLQVRVKNHQNMRNPITSNHQAVAAGISDRRVAVKNRRNPSIAAVAATKRRNPLGAARLAVRQ